ncbi:hypothetical protein [Nocardioides mesophilus]|uniref:Uncharacterized protein n=1 Tax=Nocardioides mesophilus TaxID=433659 RepID=A0A7G9R7X8_9ACTN|nr:hypothetical protein [Nocardioides mesophilus]QNN51703.1 hypothetical protein H9L09_14185 [Nocardioides mesophilus]
MTSSGMKRGLAATAVSALAMTGLPFIAGTANATPLEDQSPANTVALVTGDGGSVSIRNDGVNNTVHLVSTAGAGIDQVRYSVTHGDTTTVLGTVNRVDGVFTHEWTPDVSLLGTDVTITAEGLSGAGADVASDANDVTVSADASSVDISNASGSTVRVFNATYTNHSGLFGVISGTTSELTEDVMLAGGGVERAADVYGTPAAGIRTFKGAADFGAYPFDDATTPVDQALVQAMVDSDDAESVKLVEQSIKSVTAAVANANPAASNPNTKATVTVKDATGAPIYGAEVVQGTVIKYTDVNGQAVFDVMGDADGNTFDFVVNTTDEDGYQDAIDYKRSVTVTTYDDTASGITANASKLGAVLDFDEYNEAPVSITVLDQKNQPKAGKVVRYTWTVDPFGAAPSEAAGSGDAPETGTDGKADIPAPSVLKPGVYTLNGYVESDGNPGQSAGDMQMAPITVTMGNASLVFADGSNAQKLAGSANQTFDAVLQLEDGSVLPGREVTLNYDATGAYEYYDGADAADSFVSAVQPTGTTRISNTSAKDTTNAAGAVSINLTDPSETPQPAEYDGRLSGMTTGANEAGATSDTTDVDWLRSLAADETYFDGFDRLIDGDATPGRPASNSFWVSNADGDYLSGQTFTVSTDHGEFTPFAASEDELVADPAAKKGAEYGEWKMLGKSIQVTTDDDGRGQFTGAIEKDTGFDDDGQVTSTYTVQGGGADNTDTLEWESGQPLNPGSVTVALSDASDQTVSVLPKAPTTEDVFLDVVATDQFTNRVSQWVHISDDSAVADLYGPTSWDCNPKQYGESCYNYGWLDNGDEVLSQFTEDEPALRASSDDATSQTVSATWNATTATWDGVAGQPLAPVGGDKTLKDSSETISWYNVDFGASTYTVDATDGVDRKVGDTSHIRYHAEDQNGEPIQGLNVQFFRSGPDDLQDGEGNSRDMTGGNGDATYVFQGAKAGKAVIDTVVRLDADGEDYSLDGRELTGASRRVTVNFNLSDPRQAIVAGLKLGNNRHGDDKVKVDAPSIAEGATVSLYKIRKDGSKVLVARKSANRYGNAKFVVADANGSKVTKYKAKVGATSLSFSDWTPKGSIS